MVENFRFFGIIGFYAVIIMANGKCAVKITH